MKPDSAASRSGWAIALVSFVLLFGAALRFYGLGERSLWHDEAAAALLADPTLLGVERLLYQPLDDLQPPLHHLMLYGMSLGFGQTEFSLRLPSVAVGVLTIAFAYAAARAAFGWRVGVIAATLLALSPFHVYYSQEARPHGLLMLAGLMATYFLIRAVKRGGFWSWVGYAVSVALGCYTLLYLLTGLLVLAHGVFVVALPGDRARRLLRWCGAVVAAGVVFAPWLLPRLLFHLQVFQGTAAAYPTAAYYDIWPRPTPQLVAAILKDFFQGDFFDPGFVIGQSGLLSWRYVSFLALAPLSLAATLRRRNWPWCWLFWLCIGVPLAVLFVLSLRSSLLSTRHAAYLLPGFVVLLALGIASVGPRLRWLLLGGIVAVSFVGLANYYANPVYYTEPWRDAVAHIATEAAPGDTIVIVPEYNKTPLDFYLRGVLPIWEGPVVGLGRWASEVEATAALDAASATAGGLWLVLGHQPSVGPMVRELLAQRLPLVEERRFGSIEVYRYRALGAAGSDGAAL